MKVTRKSDLTGNVSSMELDITQEQLDEAWFDDRRRAELIFPDLSINERLFVFTGITQEELKRNEPRIEVDESRRTGEQLDITELAIDLAKPNSMTVSKDDELHTLVEALEYVHATIRDFPPFRGQSACEREVDERLIRRDFFIKTLWIWVQDRLREPREYCKPIVVETESGSKVYQHFDTISDSVHREVQSELTDAVAWRKLGIWRRDQIAHIHQRWTIESPHEGSEPDPGPLLPETIAALGHSASPDEATAQERYWQRDSQGRPISTEWIDQLEHKYEQFIEREQARMAEAAYQEFRSEQLYAYSLLYDSSECPPIIEIALRADHGMTIVVTDYSSPRELLFARSLIEDHGWHTEAHNYTKLDRWIARYGEGAFETPFTVPEPLSTEPLILVDKEESQHVFDQDSQDLHLLLLTPKSNSYQLTDRQKEIVESWIAVQQASQITIKYDDNCTQQLQLKNEPLDSLRLMSDFIAERILSMSEIDKLRLDHYIESRREERALLGLSAWAAKEAHRYELTGQDVPDHIQAMATIRRPDGSQPLRLPRDEFTFDDVTYNEASTLEDFRRLDRKLVATGQRLSQRDYIKFWRSAACLDTKFVPQSLPKQEHQPLMFVPRCDGKMQGFSPKDSLEQLLFLQHSTLRYQLSEADKRTVARWIKTKAQALLARDTKSTKEPGEDRAERKRAMKKRYR